MSYSVVVGEACVGQYCGPERSDGGSRRMVSLYVGDGRLPVTFEAAAARQIGLALLAAADGGLEQFAELRGI